MNADWLSLAQTEHQVLRLAIRQHRLTAAAQCIIQDAVACSTEELSR